MLVVTGAAGFIGSCLVRHFNEMGIDDIVIVDDFSREDKNRNLQNKKVRQRIHRDAFTAWLQQHADSVGFVFHIGARTDTTETDVALFDRLNLQYSKDVWDLCARHGIPLIYASSAATYGLGEHGYDDDHSTIPLLKPLNPYGASKQDFDKWVLTRSSQPPFWAGLKFFNVYGPNEYHKGRMASVIFHTVRQIRASGAMRLFRSHRPDFQDGHQMRDFIYVKDVASVIEFLFRYRPQSAIYNLGTGKARTFLDLATITFHSLDLEPNISFVDTPADIRDTYQYFTEARMDKLRRAGYENPFYSLEDGIRDYVRRYLREERYY